MRKAYRFGEKLQQRVDFRVNWLTGMASILYNGKVIYRRPFAFSINHTVEVGQDDKHVICIRFSVFDYFADSFYITIDGQKPVPGMEIMEDDLKPETPMDDAAAAFFFVGAVNIVFSVIGTLYVTYLDDLSVRLLLLLASLVYFLFGFKTMLHQASGIFGGTAFFLVDTLYGLYWNFSWAGLILRAVLLFYFSLGMAQYLGERALKLKRLNA